MKAISNLFWWIVKALPGMIVLLLSLLLAYCFNDITFAWICGAIGLTIFAFVDVMME